MLAAVRLKRRLRASTSQSLLGATKGRVARELPFSSALLIRLELAQQRSLRCRMARRWEKAVVQHSAIVCCSRDMSLALMGPTA